MAKKFYQQEHPATCGIAVLRTVLKNQFNISLTEKQIMKLAEAIYEAKHPHYKGQKHKIRFNGTDVFHFQNLAEFFGLKLIKRSYGSATQIKYLLKKNIWPIIHRGAYDGDGHYIVVHSYDEEYIHIFDPMRKIGGLKKETKQEFLKKWKYYDEKYFLALSTESKHIALENS